MNILIISPKNKSVFNFRGDLIRDIIRNGHDVKVIGPNQEYIDDIMKLGISEFIEIPFVKDNTSVKGDLEYFLALKKVVKRLKPDMVFSYTIKPVIYGSIAARLEKVQYIYAMVPGLGRVYASGGIKVNIIRTIIKCLYRIAFSACNKVIFQNDDDINELVGQGYLPREKAVRVNGSGVNMHRFKKSVLPQNPEFLMVSRILREKGVMEYCQAARAVRKTYPEARFILLGGFDNSIGALKREDIEPYINDGSVEFPGEVKDPVSFYQQASVFVLPSYYREGLPRTILEAMSCGRAVVTTDWPGCREPIEQGVNGFMVPVRNVSALTDKLLLLAEDEQLRSRLAENAYRTCCEKYAVEIVNQQMRDIMGY